jgi:hypothetical protein
MKKRQIEYSRNMQGSYMILTPEGRLSAHEQRMLEYNKLPGLLIPFPGGKDMEQTLWYDITGKQSLEVYLESHELNQDFLCRLLEELLGVLDGLENLLLEEKGVLLEAECIFIDRGSGKIEFGYCLGEEGELQERMQRFMEYLLTRINHKDSGAVEMAYGLYDKITGGGCALGDIRQSLCYSYPREDETEWYGETKGEADTAPAGCREEKEEKEKTGKKQGIRMETVRGRLLEIWNQLCKAVGMIKENTDIRKKEPEPFVFVPEQEEETVKKGQPTVLLSELTGKTRGILHYEGSGEGTDMEIKKLPFIIGSEPSCDGYIPGRAVSRQHARITQTDGIYFIEDLNSSNGTWVGGKGLDYKMKMSLQTNEIIQFADETFRFL